ncbi:hypothetical protein M3Y96_01033500 [Aphelenchoides besseyi]|nr:hypothetical protein M3Y96_01033500 [Aphelenchoides besseyi]
MQTNRNINLHMLKANQLLLFFFPSIIASLGIARPSIDRQTALLNEKNRTNWLLLQDQQAYEYRRVYEDSFQKLETVETATVVDIQNNEPETFQSAEQDQFPEDTELHVDSIDEWIVVKAPIVVYIVVICVIASFFSYVIYLLC